jgi:hypothetical protein
MRRLISILAAGLLAAGTLSTTVGAASAGTTAARHEFTCTVTGTNFFHVTNNSVSFFLGVPNNAHSGATARLKPSENRSTKWLDCLSATSNVLVLTNGGLALTSRSSSPGADVTLTPAGNGGNGFASQQWAFVVESTTSTFRNVKTGLFLRVRNNGPAMGQTATTGSTPTNWIVS